MPGKHWFCLIFVTCECCLVLVQGLSIAFPVYRTRNLRRALDRNTLAHSMTVTRKTTRSSARKGLSSLHSFSDVTTKFTRATTKSSAAKKNSKSKNSTRASDSSAGTDNGESRPWYHMYTKGDEEYDKYMATEWGFEKRGTVPLFEKMSLEGAQSGLSWLTILRKRDAYRRAFYGFDIDRVAAMTNDDVGRILSQEDKANPKNVVVRHRGKIESVINNARCVQKLRQENPGNTDYFDQFLWSFVNDRPILNTSWDGKSLNNIVTQTVESEAMSKALKSRGFRFVGPTTMYALMQSCGMVIDHPVDSPEWHAARARLEMRPGGYREQES